MDPSVTSVTSLLVSVGLGKYVSGIVSLVAAFVAIDAHMLPWLPVPVASSPLWYRFVYLPLSYIGGLYASAKPTPNAQAVAAATGVPGDFAHLHSLSVKAQAAATGVPPSVGASSKVILFPLVLGLSLFGLSACGEAPATTITPAIVANIQTDYLFLKSGVGVYCMLQSTNASACSAVAKAEAIADPEVASLSSLTSPSTAQGVLHDISVVITSLPAGSIPAAYAPYVADVKLLLSQLETPSAATPAP